MRQKTGCNIKKKIRRNREQIKNGSQNVKVHSRVDDKVNEISQKAEHKDKVRDNNREQIRKVKDSPRESKLITRRKIMKEPKGRGYCSRLVTSPMPLTFLECCNAPIKRWYLTLLPLNLERFFVTVFTRIVWWKADYVTSKSQVIQGNAPSALPAGKIAIEP